LRFQELIFRDDRFIGLFLYVTLFSERVRGFLWSLWLFLNSVLLLFLMDDGLRDQVSSLGWIGILGCRFL